MTMTVKCMGCGHKKVLKGKDIPRGEDPPMCEKCYMPMMAVKVEGRPRG